MMKEKKLSDYLIVKASGAAVYFDESKLLQSLGNAGASSELAQEVLEEVGQTLHEGMSTSKIYRKAYQILQRKARKSAVHYRLKQAVLQLGPSGYPFEHFIGELFKARGYEVQVGQLIEGYSVRHEVDVVGRGKENEILVECKFHNYQGTKTDVKVPMYIRSRFEDIKRARELKHAGAPPVVEGWIVTNTRFTEDAIKFAKDYGLHLLSWDYPQENKLKDWIEQENMHPITSLSGISMKEKKALLEMDIVLCRELYEKIQTDVILPIKPRNRRAVKHELKVFVGYK